MNRTWTIVLIGALSFMVFVALGGVGIDKPVRVMIVAGAVAGIAWLCWFDYGRKKNQARRTAADGENRFRELSALAAAPQFGLVVTARSSMILAAGSIVTGVGLLWWGPQSPFFLGFISGAAFLGLGVLWLLRVVPEFGAPAMVISQQGFRTPLTSQIPWEMVDGIFLREYKTDTEQTIPILSIRIDALSQHISQFALYYRVRYWLSGRAGKKQIAIFLRDPNEQPRVIYRLMRMLWTKSTGRSHDWNPLLPQSKWVIYFISGLAILYIGYAIIYILNIFFGKPG